MRSTVLFVDPSAEWQRFVMHNARQGPDGIDPLVADTASAAFKLLATTTIRVVVCEKRMPDMEAASWFDRLHRLYPDIPTIIATTAIGPDDRNHAAAFQVRDFFDKTQPFTTLIQMIKAMLESETEGGSLQTIPLEMFVQIIEMEQKTCTIRVINESETKIGVLFFKNGELIDARLGRLRGKPAAYVIFSWDNVLLCIQNTCAVSTNRINEYLQAFLMNAIARKDEAKTVNEAYASPRQTPSGKPSDAVNSPEEQPLDAIRKRINQVNSTAIEDIYMDAGWDPLMEKARGLGAVLNAGQLKACYLENGKAFPVILVPGAQTVVVSVQPGASRDPILNAIVA